MTAVRPSAPATDRAVTRATRVTELPAWPLLLALGGMPVWWVVGLLPFVPLAYAAVIVTLLLARRPGTDVRVLPGTGPLLLFVGWATAAAVMLERPRQLIGFGMRWVWLLAALLVLVHIANAPRLTDRRILTAVAALWGLLLVGGYLGVLLPHGGFSTPMARLLPGSIVENDLVAGLVRPQFAEVQHPWGAAQAFNRPAAPFPYTNGWGCAFALLTPLMLAWRRLLRRRWARSAVLAGITASLLPAVLTRNRGMLLMAGVVVLAYLVGQLVRRNWRAVLKAGLGLSAAVVALDLLGVVALITERAAVSDSIGGRGEIYRQTWEAVLSSPVLGYGAPRPNEDIGIALGTQGALWMYLFSYGIPGAAFFAAFLTGVAARSLRVPDRTHLWMHAAVVGACVGFLFYGFDGTHLLVLAATSGMVLRAARSPQGEPAGDNS